MGYSREQRKVAQRIYRRGRKRGVSHKEMVAAFETGLVESSMRNLKYGDADSRGWRQERASIYKDPNNLNHSIDRFFNETKAAGRGHGKSAGQLAQAVQRSAFPGRYDQVGKQANDLRKWAKKQYQRGGGKSGGGGGSHTKTTTHTTPGIDNSGTRQDLKLAYLQQRGNPDALLNLAAGLKGAQDVPGKTTTKTVRVKGAKGHGKAGRDKSGAYPHGVGPHATPNLLIHIGHLAQKMGLHVGENPNFGGTSPVHASGSYHYKNEALDISGDPKKMAHLAKVIQRRYGKHLAELIHNSGGRGYAIKHGKRVNGPSFYSGVWGGHASHVHVAVGRSDHGRS